MKAVLTILMACIIFFGFAGSGTTATTIYTSESSYLTALSGLSYATIVEGFEGSAWNTVRNGNTAPSISDQGLTWTAGTNVGTFNGMARTGDFGLSAHPNGAAGSTDSINVCSTITLFGVGGWFTGFGAANVNIDLDDSYSGATTTSPLTSFQFIGVIDTDGFTSLGLYTTGQLPGTIGNWGADDFTLAHPVPIPGALWLLGSGCIGIFGIRRRINK
jgi:hypothetical protein